MILYQVLGGSGNEAKGKPLFTETAANGAVIADITAPDREGISSNQFDSFQVGKPGFIFNNSLTGVRTETAGDIKGNRNLTDSTATLIIGEVTGMDRSLIRGNLEIAGDRANLLIANPNGLTFDGGKIINADKVSFLAGTANFTGNAGKLNIGRQDISVLGGGLAGGGTGQLNLLGNTAEVDGTVSAENLNILLGEGMADYGNWTLTSKTGSRTEPEIFMEISSRGKLSAGSIFVASETKRIGLKQNGEIDASRTLRIGMKGNMLLNGLTHGGSAEIRTVGDIENNGVFDGGRVYMKGNTLINQGGIFGESVSLSVFDLDNAAAVNQPARDGVTSGGTGGAGASSENSSDIDTGGVIYAAKDMEIGAAHLYNHRGAVLYSDGDIHIGGHLDEADAAAGAGEALYNDGGSLQTTGLLSIRAAKIQNTNPELKIQTEEGRWIDDPERLEIDAPDSAYNHVIATLDHFSEINNKSSYRYNIHIDKKEKMINFDREQISRFIQQKPLTMGECGGIRQVFKEEEELYEQAK